MPEVLTGVPHKHAWKMAVHIDNCHSYGSAYECECGATARTNAERDLVADPYSAIWMDDEGRDEPCERCHELMAGAPVRGSMTVWGADGSVEEESNYEHEQGGEDA